MKKKVVQKTQTPSQEKAKATERSEGKGELVPFNVGYRWDRWDSLIGQYRITLEFFRHPSIRADFGDLKTAEEQLFALSHAARLVAAGHDTPANLKDSEQSSFSVSHDDESPPKGA